jgi:hypothetical protein
MLCLAQKQSGRLVLADEESIENLLNEMERVRDIYNRQLEAFAAGAQLRPGVGFTKVELISQIETWRDELNVTLARYGRH